MKKHWISGSLGVLAILLTAAWAMGFFESEYSDDPEVAELEKMRDEAINKPDDEREQYKDQFRQRIEGMSSEQRQSFFERSMPIFIKMGAARMERQFDEFLAKSPEEQRQAMDDKIDQQLAREKQGKTDRPGPPGGKPAMTAERADAFRKQMNDWTTPEQRAKFDAVIGMYNDRREERGLPPAGPGRWR